MVSPASEPEIASMPTKVSRLPSGCVRNPAPRSAVMGLVLSTYKIQSLPPAPSMASLPPRGLKKSCASLPVS